MIQFVLLLQLGGPVEIAKRRRVREYLEIQRQQEDRIRTETELDIADTREGPKEIEFVLDRPTVETYADVIVEEIIREVITEVTEITEIKRSPEITEITEEITEEVTEEVIEEVTEEITEEVIEEVTEEITEEVIEEVTEEVTEEVIEEVTTEVTEKVTEVTEITEVKQAPKFIKVLESKETTVKEEVRFECQVTGVPQPTVTWFHDGQIIEIEEVGDAVDVHGKITVL